MRLLAGRGRRDGGARLDVRRTHPRSRRNRIEALGEAQETVDFFRHYADDFEQHGSYEHELPNDPLPDIVSRNRSVMRPYGAWAVIAPFNFPLALAGGPTAAALVTGNTVVVKGATDTPWAGRLLADCIRDAGLPPGVFQYLSGSGREVGEALSRIPQRPASRSPDPLPSARSWCSAWRRDPGHVRALPRWVARIPASSRRGPISTMPPPVSSARPTAWGARSAPPCRACTSTARWPTS